MAGDRLAAARAVLEAAADVVRGLAAALDRSIQSIYDASAT
jgi:hypothetical protein